MVPDRVGFRGRRGTYGRLVTGNARAQDLLPAVYEELRVELRREGVTPRADLARG